MKFTKKLSQHFHSPPLKNYFIEEYEKVSESFQILKKKISQRTVGWGKGIFVIFIIGLLRFHLGDSFLTFTVCQDKPVLVDNRASPQTFPTIHTLYHGQGGAP